MAADERLLSLAAIADLAGVTKAAVGNWRRRHADFPTPRGIGGADLYRQADVERWLRHHGKEVREQSLEQRLVSLLDLVRGEAKSHDVLRAALEVTAGEEISTAYLRANKSAAVDHFTRSLANLINRDGAINVFEAALTLFQNSSGMAGEFDTPPQLAELVVKLAGDIPEKVYDPACGTGGMLLSAAQAGQARTTLFGHDINHETARIAQMRLRLHGLDNHIIRGNAFIDNPFHNQEFDLIISQPPFGLAWKPDAIDLGRLPLGIPPRSSLDMAWVQLPLTQLSHRGRAIMVLAPGTVFRGGAEAGIRKELVGRGCLEAIIALPPSLYRHTAIASIIWILRRPASVNNDQVLLIDASGLGQRSGRRVTLHPDASGRLQQLYHQWRQHGQVLEGPIPAHPVAVWDLLREGANLAPRRWIPRPGQNPEVSLTLLKETEDRLRQTTADLKELSEPKFTNRLMISQGSPRRARLRDLAESGYLSSFRGYRLEETGEERPGIPIIQAKDIQHGWVMDPTMTVNIDREDRRVQLTRPGDVVVLSHPGTIKAGVDRVGGRVASHSLQVLRPNKRFIHPTILAALLNSSWTQELLDGAGTSPNILDLEVPLLDQSDSAILRNILQDLEEHRQRTQRATEAASAVLSALINGIASGSLQPRIDSTSNE